MQYLVRKDPALGRGGMPYSMRSSDNLSIDSTLGKVAVNIDYDTDNCTVAGKIISLFLENTC